MLYKSLFLLTLTVSPLADQQDRMLFSWADAAVSAHMTYGVLTVKHVAGFCLWDSKHTTYDVMHPDCPYQKDLVAQFIKSFKSRGLKVGLYYCWRHPGFGDPGKYKVLPPECDPATHTMEEQIEFQKKQIAELVEKYPDVFYIWNDALDRQGHARGGSTSLHPKPASQRPRQRELVELGQERDAVPGYCRQGIEGLSGGQYGSWRNLLETGTGMVLERGDSAGTPRASWGTWRRRTAGTRISCSTSALTKRARLWNQASRHWRKSESCWIHGAPKPFQVKTAFENRGRCTASIKNRKHRWRNEDVLDSIVPCFTQ